MTRRPKTKAGRKCAQTWRLKKLLEAERELWQRDIQLIAGVDEVGRGPLAGPVLAAAVMLPVDVGIRGVDDSKKLSAEKRESLFLEIREQALAIGVGAASSREIDRINILRASHLAMQRALRKLPLRPQHVFVDGLPIPGFEYEHTAVIDGDAKIHCIACASIVAKVIRDRLMRMLSGRYPVYNWASNCGYSTADHRQAIIDAGLTPHHRRSFDFNQQLTLDLDALV
ncbi:MAG: ribonuclease HII [Gemmatimonadota bacterium]